MSLKNKDLLKSISDRFIKPKNEDAETSEEVATPDVVAAAPVTQEKPKERSRLQNVTATSNQIALDVMKIGRDYYVIEIEYNLDTMKASVLSSTVLDNKVVALSFGHGKSGIDSIITRNKKFKKDN